MVQASNAGSNVIQMAHQVNPLGINSQLQKVNTALPKDGKYTLMRGVDATQMFVYCPAETPEGHGAGLLQNLALFSMVRLGTESLFVVATLLHQLNDMAPVPIVTPLVQRNQMQDATIVFVNGEPVATTRSPEALIELCREARRRMVLPHDVSVIMTAQGVALFTDMGTVVFPLVHLATLRAKQDVLKQPGEIFQNLVNSGIIEYVDAWELLDYRVAFTQADLLKEAAGLQELIEHGLERPMAYTHLAVHPCAFLGTSACTVPWSDHDQAPRVSYQAGMVKQAVSTPASTVDSRLDFNYAHTLWYPQRPMADTIVSESRKVHDWPMGENLMIAIASYEGLSQEDAIVRSRAAVERGSGRITVRRTLKAVVRKVSASDYEAFESPLEARVGLTCIGQRAESDYSKVDSDGLPEESTHVRNGDVVIGRVYYTTDDSGKRVRRDRSIILTCEDTETFLVHRVAVTVNRDGLRQVRVVLRSTRVPQVGDKISDRHGQKGVIGALVNQEDLPYVESGPNAGMTPDAIVNLHCINGRMTLGKLLEMLYSSLGLAEAHFVDATPFKYVNARWAMQQLMDSGFGVETYMINGMTGERYAQPWFIGCCFYQSLKHMVLDKIAARNRGPRAQLTRQPLDGRAHQGGQRMGEMERDAFLAHGASFTLDDRSRVASDAHVAPVCEQCHQVGETATKFTIAEMAKAAGVHMGQVCRCCGGPVQMIDTTYCYSKVLLRELATIGIKVEHFLEEAPEALRSSLDALDLS